MPWKPSFYRRRRPASLLVAAAGALLMSACAPDNQAACQSYVAVYNSCTTEPVDALETCPASLNNTSADCAGYYDCLQQSQTCVGGTLTGDTSGCSGCI